MNRKIPHLKPILASNRIGWAIPTAVLCGCLCIVLLFLATPNRDAYRPYFVEPGLAKFDPNALMDTASFRDHLGGAR